MKKIRVLVVEDSRFFQELLVRGINSDSNLEVVAVATDPFEARDAIVEHRPDVMTLDVELPRMNGIEFLRRLMPQYTIPVVVVSSLNSMVFDAMAAGAVEFVNKPVAGTSAEGVNSFIVNELNTKIKIASTAKLGKLKQSLPISSDRRPSKEYGNAVIAIGASTGGTEAIFDVVKGFDKDIPGVVVVQHMPAGFTGMYAERLNNQCRVVVKEARTGDIVQQGKVLIAPGDSHMKLVRSDGFYRVECKPGPKVSGHCPSVDVLFDSVARAAKDKAIGIILTGMGGDGANGLLAMRQAGAETIGQNEASCVVYGMPKVAYDLGAVKHQMDLSAIPRKVYQILDRMKP